VAAGWLRAGSLTARFLQAVLRDSLRASATVIALDRFMARRVQEKGIDPDRIVILPPWSHDDVVRYDAAGRQRFRSAHDLDGKFVVMHSGNHTPCHPLTTLLEAADELRSRPDIAFCFVGGGSELPAVRRFAESRGLKNIVVVPYQPLHNLAASLCAADLHIVLMGDPFVGIIHPSKVYNIRALGIPYLYIGPVQSHVSELKPAFSAAHRDVDAVVHHIRASAAEAAAGAERFCEPAPSRDRLLGQMVFVLENGSVAALTGALATAERSHQL
jgi:glycosyltransferase involved in cell wall biosynthesis